MVTDRATTYYDHATGTWSATPRDDADAVVAYGSVHHLDGWGWVWLAGGWSDVESTREEAQRAAEAWLRRRGTP